MHTHATPLHTHAHPHTLTQRGPSDPGASSAAFVPPHPHFGQLQVHGSRISASHPIFNVFRQISPHMHLHIGRRVLLARRFGDHPLLLLSVCIFRRVAKQTGLASFLLCRRHLHSLSSFFRRQCESQRARQTKRHGSSGRQLSRENTRNDSERENCGDDTPARRCRWRRLMIRPLTTTRTTRTKMATTITKRTTTRKQQHNDTTTTTL